MRFERCCSVCELRRSRWQPCTPARLPTQKQSRNLMPRPIQRSANRKSEHAFTKSQRHDGDSEGHALQHVNFQKAVFILRELNAPVSPPWCNWLQWLTCKMPDRMSHRITTRTRATPNSMTSPSRMVNLDRFIAPLQRRKATKEDSKVGRTVLFDGGWG